MTILDSKLDSAGMKSFTVSSELNSGVVPVAFTSVFSVVYLLV